jgi:peptide-methionine (S)-S-oxide reductase
MLSWRDESTAQDYPVHNPSAPYIAFNDIPKVNNFRRIFPDLYSPQPVLVNEAPPRRAD